MADLIKLQNLESEAVRIRSEITRERNEHIFDFQKRMNKMISNTPTGDLRNDLTDLNILFMAIVGYL